MMRTLDQAGDFNGKRVLVRADFDVPVSADGTIQESYRITCQKENLQYLTERGAQVTLISHISAVPSFEPLLPQITELLGMAVDVRENLRAHPGEEANNAAFAQSLAEGFDLYINNAFAVCHRTHASVATLPTLLPSYAGLLVQQEVSALEAAVATDAAGKVVFMGGAKASTKVPVIKSLLPKAQNIAVGGVIANDILRERGVDVGTSKVDDDAHELLVGVDVHDDRLVVPDDFVRDGTALLDVGPQSAQRFATLAGKATMIIWNGPMGRFEDERYIGATRTLAEAIASSSAHSVIGGGDTVAALDSLGIGLDRFGFVSTGGGAMLTFLAGQRLPGLEALGYYDDHA